jgi:uncharacterized protein YndB with AHSA1/START domain
MSIAVRALLMLAVALAAPTVRAEVKAASGDSFVIAYSQRIEVAPARAYAALPAIDRWWSSGHTWSGDAANLSLKAEAGSCFCERWTDGTVEHGRVIMAKRDQLLRLQTALGPLQAMAVTGVLTFQLKPDDKGGAAATVLTLTYVVNGAGSSALDKLAPAVNDVLGEQFSRLVRFIETGKATAP